MQSYRMDLNASICLTVHAKSEKEAIEKAEQAIADFEHGFELPSGDGYEDVQLYTSSEESAEVMDIVDEDDCTCEKRSWYGKEHDSACPLAGQPREVA